MTELRFGDRVVVVTGARDARVTDTVSIAQ